MLLLPALSAAVIYASALGLFPFHQPAFGLGAMRGFREMEAKSTHG